MPLKRPLPIAIGNISGLISVDEHIEALSVIDFRNTLKLDKVNSPALQRQIRYVDNDYILSEYTYNADNRKGYFLLEKNFPNGRHYSSRFYSNLLLAYEVNDVGKLTSDEETFGTNALHSFIESYKFSARDSLVRLPEGILEDRLVIREGLSEYDAEDVNLDLVHRLLRNRPIRIGIKHFTAWEVNKSVPHGLEESEGNFERLENQLLSAVPLRGEFRMLSKAFDELDRNRNYKYALLESFMIVEQVISEATRKMKLEKGVSKGKLDDYEDKVGISYLLNVELPYLLDNPSKDERMVLGDIDKVRKIRNDVVHKGHNVSAEEARHALFATSKLLELMAWRKLL